MRRTVQRRMVSVIAAAGLALALTACDDDADADAGDSQGSGATSSPSSGSGATSAAPTTDAAADPAPAESDAGDDGRAFDSTDDAVIIAVEKALSGQNAQARWEGSTLVVELDGSIDDVTAGLHCLTPNSLIAADETAVFAYPDGDFDCEERR